MRRSPSFRSYLIKVQPAVLALVIGLVLITGPAAGIIETPPNQAVDNKSQTVDEGGEEIPCNTTTTTILPPVVGVAIVDEPADDPCPPAEEAETVEPEPTTTTTARAQIVAVDDFIEVTVGREMESFNVTKNDSISPSLGRMAIVAGEMPDGVRLWVDNSLEGWVIGTPNECGSFSVEYSIEGTSRSETPPSDTATATVEVDCGDNSGPLEPTDDDVTVKVGERLEFDLVANDSPSAGIALINFQSGELPAGVTVWAGGWLTGTPSERGEFEFTYEVNGRNGSTESATVTMTVD